MNYNKLHLSFLLLLIMTVIQFLVSVFILQHMIITILSVIAFALCLAGLLYTIKKADEEQNKKK